MDTKGTSAAPLDRPLSAAPVPPSGCWDCHVHVFGPAARFPLTPARSYTPGEASADAVEAMLDAMGVEHVVLVQPSPYGTDNRCLLDALDRLGPRARAVAALEADMVSREVVADWKERGVRGLRVNPNGLASQFDDDLASGLRRLLSRLDGTGWHVEINVSANALDAFAPHLRGAQVPVVLDHLAHLSLAGPDTEQHVDHLLGLLDSGQFWMKISGMERLARSEAEKDQLGQIVLRLMRANPERLVWGSDWPHTPLHEGRTSASMQPFRQVDTASLLTTMLDWLSSTDLRRRICVDNPVILYG